MIVAGFVWVVVAPFMIVLWYWFSWVALLLIAAAIWTTYDYIRKGDMACHITEAVSAQGHFVTDGTIESFGHEKD